MSRGRGLTCAVDGCETGVICKGFCQRHYTRYKKYGNPLAGRTSPIDARAYLDALCKLPRGENCVIWSYSRDQDGYAKLGSRERPCRVICEKVHGPPPNPKDHSAHSCGKGMDGCVAWWHLSWKSLAENNSDKVTHGTSSKGEKNPKVVLTPKEVLEIRDSELSVNHLSSAYGVHKTTIYFVKRRKTWSWL